MADLNALLVFAKVVEGGSFSEAARRLQLPVSTVSRRITDLEEQLGLRLLERSTRSLRLTPVGAEVYEHAQHGADLSEAVDAVVSNHHDTVSGTLRLAAPPSISDSLLAPLIVGFQANYPEVRVQVFVTERPIDHISEAVDLVFRVGPGGDVLLTAQTLLTYRHQLVASPAYLERHPAPTCPLDLQGHRLLAFSRWQVDPLWSFAHERADGPQQLSIEPHLSMNDYLGLTAALLAGVGIGELPPIVQPDLLREGRLVEVMPAWKFEPFDLSILHLKTRYLTRPVRTFKDFAAAMTPALFPDLPR